jgi:hypothetical protein
VTGDGKSGAWIAVRLYETKPFSQHVVEGWVLDFNKCEKKHRIVSKSAWEYNWLDELPLAHCYVSAASGHDQLAKSDIIDHGGSTTNSFAHVANGSQVQVVSFEAGANSM